MSAPATALRVRGLRKSFGGVHAVRGVDLELRAGRIHALLGENGAGKSTLVNLVSGALAPDDGTIEIGGTEVRLNGPSAAQDLGVRTVHQELELAGALTVAENVFMGRLPAARGHVRYAALHDRTRDVLAELGVDLDPGTRVDTLSVADRQLVEIARALAARPAVLFLDEPTAALTPVEVERLIVRLRALTASGVAVLYISHRLDEVFEVADEVTVLRDGVVALHADIAATDRATVVRAMLGVELAARVPVRSVGTGDAVVTVQGLSVPPALRSASFRLDRGEVVGFFGLSGSGHDLIAAGLFGLAPCTAERVDVHGSPSLPADPREALRRGLGYVPADRKTEGLALSLSIADNVVMSAQSRLARRGVRRTRAERALVARLVAAYRMKIGSMDDKVSSLSGGNQQKVVLARLAARGDLSTLVLREPTRGVDVGAKAEIYGLLREFVGDGGTAMVISSDAEEIEAVCDRVYIVRRGEVVSELPAGALDVSRLTAAAL